MSITSNRITLYAFAYTLGLLFFFICNSILRYGIKKPSEEGGKFCDELLVLKSHKF